MQIAVACSLRLASMLTIHHYDLLSGIGKFLNECGHQAIGIPEKEINEPGIEISGRGNRHLNGIKAPDLILSQVSTGSRPRTLSSEVNPHRDKAIQGMRPSRADLG